MTTETTEAGPYGLMAEFATPEAILEAAKEAAARGYRAVDAYSPIPVHGLAEAIGFRRNRVATLVLLGGLTGGFTGFFMQWFASVIHYPIIVGGKPYNSWPSFMPITFELTVLFAAGTAVVGMLALNGLPRPYNPVFNVPGFARASQSRFFLCIQAKDPQFDHEATRRFLEELNPIEVNEVPW